LSPLPFETEKLQWVFYDANDEILFSEIPHFQTYSRNERFEKYLIAVEDKHFRSHIGIDFGALTRAAFHNLKQDKITSGASTITMQLARLLFLENETHNWKYKVRQIFYALKLEAQFSKDEILKMYLEQVYFGNNATGINAAANAYFDRPTTTLSSAQMATLIGIIPRPDTWNPIVNPKIAQERREQVLEILSDKELITDEDLELYKKQSIHTKTISPKEFRAPHFVLWAKQELQEEMKNQHGKIHVRTTLDGKTYTKVLNLIRKNIEESRLKNISNMSVVSLRQPENSLEIMVGSHVFFDIELIHISKRKKYRLRKIDYFQVYWL
jgi:membrane peptidoglycan carboxypeptidase